MKRTQRIANIDSLSRAQCFVKRLNELYNDGLDQLLPTVDRWLKQSISILRYEKNRTLDTDLLLEIALKLHTNMKPIKLIKNRI